MFLCTVDFFLGGGMNKSFLIENIRNTGELLWEFQLPAGGFATPATYAIDGNQYVVIAAGGGGMQGTESGDYYFAFKLPEN
jgi:quinoprotein glucose dehydrogenase